MSSMLFTLKLDSVNTTDTRDKIERVWENWCYQADANGGRGIVCPLKCKSVGFGEKHGLRQTDLDWP